MPRNRRPVDRESKRAEIVSTALAVLGERGYNATSMGSLAAAAGVTSTTVYWYFRDKDAVLLAAADAAVERTLAEVAGSSTRTPVERVLQVLEGLRRHHRLVTAVHARVAASEDVAAWHERFHAATGALLAAELRTAGVAEDRVGTLATTVTLVLEGLLTHETDEAATRRVVELLLWPVGG